MTKFSSGTTTNRKTAAKSPIKTTVETVTYEGGQGYARDAKSDLFLLAVVNMVGENTFYESASDRDARFRNLVHTVTKEDPKWMQEFIPFLREKMFMRSASTVAAAEYVKAGGPNGRAVVASALQRADEPGEILGYWVDNMKYSTPGALPAALKRGVSDAAVRLYNEVSLLKYDGQSKNWRLADVINVAHPKPKAVWQSELFKYAIDRRFDRPINIEEENLPKISAWLELQAIPAEDRREYLRKNGKKILEAGISWEMLSGWINGPMDAEVWEAVIPNMGYMALLRNLRNFDQANISAKSVKFIQNKLADPEEVAKSKQFPYRFLSAYTELNSERWNSVLAEALDLSTQNIPELGGSTIIYTDTSSSMTTFGYSARSKITPAKAAALFAAALAKKGEKTRLIQYATTWVEKPVNKVDSTLRVVEKLVGYTGEVGHGTNTWEAVNATYNGEDRVFIFTDMQAFSHRYGASKIKAPIYSFNLGGYDRTHTEIKDNRYELGGLSDAVFTMVSLLETTGRTGWPWEKK